MSTIRVETLIAAPATVCFDLARDMRVHEQTTTRSNERVVEVRRNGVQSDVNLLELGDEVTFEAKHLGIRQRLTSKIVSYDRPLEFVDEMQKGAFRSLRHIHRFEESAGGTKMIDILDFRAPGWIFGSMAETLFLTSYMRRFTEKRGAELKKMAEARPSQRDESRS